MCNERNGVEKKILKLIPIQVLVEMTLKNGHQKQSRFGKDTFWREIWRKYLEFASKFLVKQTIFEEKL